MKPKILNITALVVIAMVIMNSFTAVGQLRYGFRFGGDFAKASLSNSSALFNPVHLSSGEIEPSPGGASLSNRSGFSGGLMLEYQFEKCGFAPDIAVLYTRYNTRISFRGNKPESFGRNFIEIPIHFKWKFWIPQTKNLFAPMIYTGPSVMFRLGHNKGASYDDNDGLMEQIMPTALITKTFKTNIAQPGWDLGIGFDVINFIQITAGYRFGLGNALSDPADATLRTNGWNLSANILFDF